MKRTKPSLVEIGWTAGIMDGEGSISAGPRPAQNGKLGNGCYTRVSVCNTDIRMLKLLKRLWGGFISSAKVDRANRCEDIYSWGFQHKSLLPFLEAVEPHLIVKRRQAQLVIKLQRRISGNWWRYRRSDSTGRYLGRALSSGELSIRGKMFKRIKALNFRGGYHGRNRVK